MEKERITIEITDREGNVRQHSENDGHTELVWYGSYEPGDRIRVYALSDRFVRIQADQLLSPANVYIKKGCFDFPIPFGSAKEAYPQEAFTGILHQLSAFYIEKTSDHKLLSENPLDVREENTEKLAGENSLPFYYSENEVYPHCTANVETRGEAIFAARNTIDGVLITPGHGFYPFTSWGNANDPASHIDLWFGRKVCVDEVHLFLRSDFPHDNYWKNATLSFDGGITKEITLEKTGNCQAIVLDTPIVTESVRLGSLVKDENEPSPFASLIQWRVFGREA
ncbi:MAG: hypothetical protein IJ873_02050 [Lachnospiraceae bacterium]|nr:hypothetical protein [Lachnospiraceae bacterium]